MENSVNFFEHRATDKRPTKHEIAEYYSDPNVRRVLLKQLINKSVLAVHTLPQGDVMRRNDANRKPIKITQARNDASNKNDLAWYTDRRFSEFHPAIGKKTRQLWVDIDPGPKRNLEELKPLIADVENTLKTMPEVKSTSITYSGDRGFHVRGELRKKTPTDEVRERLNLRLQPLLAGGVVMTPPKGDQVRLDTSTLHNKGSIRAEYSLNSRTGRVAIPLTQRELRGFTPEQAQVQRVLKEKEFAPGIPRSKRIYALPEKNKEQTWTLAVQEHDAAKAGKHWDLRLIDRDTGFAHSWAVPKARFPEEKQKLLAVRTPTHTSHYALNYGANGPQEIKSGYGKGSVEIVHKEAVKVLKSNNNRVDFERSKGDKKERYQLFRTKDNMWLLRRSPDLMKVGSNMRGVYTWGYRAALTKLGMETKNPNLQSTADSQQPLETADDHLPAGQLASILTNLEGPESSTKAKSLTPVKTLERPVTWSSSREIPSSYMDGPTTTMPGEF